MVQLNGSPTGRVLVSSTHRLIIHQRKRLSSYIKPVFTRMAITGHWWVGIFPNSWQKIIWITSWNISFIFIPEFHTMSFGILFCFIFQENLNTWWHLTKSYCLSRIFHCLDRRSSCRIRNWNRSEWKTQGDQRHVTRGIIHQASKKRTKACTT